MDVDGREADLHSATGVCAPVDCDSAGLPDRPLITRFEVIGARLGVMRIPWSGLCRRQPTWPSNM